MGCRKTTPARRRMMAAIPAVMLGAGFLVAGGAVTSAAPADNGTVKIHNVGTPHEDPRDEPKVCGFYIAAFDFDANQTLDYRIVAGPGFKGAASKSGSLSLDADGDGHTATMKLSDGMYKLFVTFDGQKGAAKHKVFKVDCEDTPTTPSPTVEPTPSPTVEPTPSPTVEPTVLPTVLPTDGPTVPPTDPSPSPEPSTGVGGVFLPPTDDGTDPVGAVDTGGGGAARESSAT
jgi:hypothetical protein